MSVCISNSGEYSAHKLDSDFICNRCFAFGEEEDVTEIETLTEQHKFEMMRAKSAEAETARLRAMIAEAAFWVEKNIGSQAAKAYMNGLAKDTAAPTFEEGNDRG